MPHRTAWIRLVLIAALFVGPALAAAEPTPILPVAEVKRGMKGYGKTVFSGTAIEKFDVEVIDVLHRFLPGIDIILIRVSHPVTDKANVIAGMSGSPIYLNDKLVGALSYGWSFSKEPIAGVTPIEAMLAETRRPLLKTGALDRPRLPAGFEPCITPLSLAGFSGRGTRWLTDSLRELGIEPVQGGNAGEVPAGEAEAVLEPGAAIGVTMIRGDLSAVATGTVTWVDGDQVLAFGHPFLGGGDWRMPVTTARINHVLASVARSFKLSSPIRDVGALLQDRLPCIYAKKGESAPMVPVVIHTRHAETGHDATFRYEVIQHPGFTPMLVNSVLSESLDASENMTADNTVTADITLQLTGGEPFTFREVMTNPGAVWNPAMITELFGLLQNPLERVTLARVEMTLAIESGNRAATIEKAWFERERARPGETIPLTVQFRRFQGPQEFRRVDVVIPATQRPGVLEIAVTTRAETPSELPPPVTARDLTAQILARPPATAFVVSTPAQGLNLRVNGAVLPQMPNSVLGSLAPTLVAPADLAPALRRQVVETPWVVSGTAQASVRVVE